MSDEAIRRRSGRGWQEWFKLLDESGAAEKSHAEIARWLKQEAGISGWDAQGITVSYERARGRRKVGEGPSGFSASVSRTVNAPVGTLFDAFVKEDVRRRWLPDATLRERTATRPKSARFDWEDGRTRLIAYFTAKGEDKSAVAIEHEKLADAEEAAELKAFWRERLDALKALFI